MKRISFGLSVSEIEDAKKELKDYRKSITKKCRKLVRELGKQGIEVAKVKAGESGMGKYLLFKMEVTSRVAYARAIVYATSTGLIRSEWRNLNSASGIAVADVSPLLMIEFGAGINHDKNPKAHELGMGAGTFPGQTHALNPSGWYYMDMDYEWHWSDGIEPTMPMYSAAMSLHEKIARTAREVFRS